MEIQDKYIRFDWAIKRLLRNKVNFGVLEGFLTVLIGDEIHIMEILESEGNQQTENDKFNRVDIKALNSKGEIIIIEIQNTRELYYLERILYGVAKAITEHISLGETYYKIKKIYSISILYFRHRARVRLPLSRTEYIQRGAYGGLPAGQHTRKGRHRTPDACRNLPRVFPDPSE